MRVDGRTRDALFGDIVCGGVCLYQGKPYMRTQWVEGVTSNGNAVNLESGHLRAILDTEPVIAKPLARLMLEGKPVPRKDAYAPRDNSGDDQKAS